MFVEDNLVTGCLQQPEPGDRYERRGRSILIYVDVPDEPGHPDTYAGPIAIHYLLWQTINDITHAVEIWRCTNRIRLHDLPPWM